MCDDVDEVRERLAENRYFLFQLEASVELLGVSRESFAEMISDLTREIAEDEAPLRQHGVEP